MRVTLCSVSAKTFPTDVEGKESHTFYDCDAECFRGREQHNAYECNVRKELTALLVAHTIEGARFYDNVLTALKSIYPIGIVTYSSQHMEVLMLCQEM